MEGQSFECGPADLPAQHRSVHSAHAQAHGVERRGEEDGPARRGAHRLRHGVPAHSGLPLPAGRDAPGRARVSQGAQRGRQHAEGVHRRLQGWGWGAEWVCRHMCLGWGMMSKKSKRKHCKTPPDTEKGACEGPQRDTAGAGPAQEHPPPRLGSFGYTAKPLRESIVILNTGHPWAAGLQVVGHALAPPTYPFILMRQGGLFDAGDQALPAQCPVS